MNVVNLSMSSCHISLIADGELLRGISILLLSI